MFDIRLLNLSCTIFYFDAIYIIVSRSMNFDNPHNTVYTAVELVMSEQWFPGSPNIWFCLALLVNLYPTIHT